MTPKRLAEIRARRDALMEVTTNPHLPSSYRLVKEDVPCLLAEVDRLRAALEEIVAMGPGRAWLYAYSIPADIARRALAGEGTP